MFFIIFVILFSSFLYGAESECFFKKVDVQGYVSFDMGLQSTDKEFLNNLSVNRDKAWHHFGDHENMLQSLVEFFITIGNQVDDAYKAAGIVQKMSEKTLRDINAPAGWILLKSLLKRERQDVLSWHIDSYYNTSGWDIKIVCTLKGPGTLFAVVDNDMRAKFLKTRCNTTYYDKNIQDRHKHMIEEYQAKVMELFQDCQIEQVGLGQGVLFIVGDPIKGVIHSEPFITEDRLFFSIIPGTKEQIKRLHDKWYGIRP